jgi:hypothetical protein
VGRLPDVATLAGRPPRGSGRHKDLLALGTHRPPLVSLTRSRLQYVLGLRPRLDVGARHFELQVSLTKIAQGWPKLWASFRALIGMIFSQTVGPSLAIWVNPVQFSFLEQFSAVSNALERLHAMV